MAETPIDYPSIEEIAHELEAMERKYDLSSIAFKERLLSGTLPAGMDEAVIIDWNELFTAYLAAKRPLATNDVDELYSVSRISDRMEDASDVEQPQLAA